MIFSNLKNIIRNNKILLGSGALLGSGCFYNMNKKKYYTIEELEEHNKEGDIWVEHKRKIYNVSDFVNNHPGGKDKILLAGGSSITPYWNLYKQHNTPEIDKILNQYFIGYLDPEETIDEDNYNHYIEDPIRHTNNFIHKKEPYNCEPFPQDLINDYLTPKNIWFIRNHHPVPKLDKDYSVKISGNGLTTINLSLEDIKNKYHKKDIISTIQCAGNRRKEFNNLEKTLGLNWNIGAISNAKWSGISLKEVINDLKENDQEFKNNKHIHFIGYDAPFATSISIQDFLEDKVDILIAYEMNDLELQPDNGYPIRIIAPGYAGSKNVKWIKEIIFSHDENDSNWQSGIAYKILPNFIKKVENIDPKKIKNISTIEKPPIQSFICYPLNNSTFKINELENLKIKGIAYSGGGKNITKVEVSVDKINWLPVDLKSGADQNINQAWAWTFWEYKLDKNITKNIIPGKYNIYVRAYDVNNEKQTDNLKQTWNLRGLNNNNYHNVECKISR